MFLGRGGQWYLSVIDFPTLHSLRAFCFPDGECREGDTQKETFPRHSPEAPACSPQPTIVRTGDAPGYSKARGSNTLFPGGTGARTGREKALCTLRNVKIPFQTGPHLPHTLTAKKKKKKRGNAFSNRMKQFQNRMGIYELV